MKKIILLFVFLFSLSSGLFAQSVSGDSLKYRISLTDKSATTYTLDRPQEYLSAKAIARRQKQNLSVDSTDLPVCRKYVDAIRKKGVHVVATGKWDNFVTVSCNDSTLIDEIARLPFVRSTERVWKSNKPQPVPNREALVEDFQRTDSIYGTAWRQLEMSRGNLLHEAGFKGQGMTIAVIDGGFNNTDKIKVMQGIRILGTKDFVNPKSNIYEENTHGQMVLSCLAMNQPYVMIGTAPEASYWLLRSEDVNSENMVEEDYWAAAIEFADSVGVDLVNTSLGYYAYDDPSKSYRYRDLNGSHGLISRQASKAADKGIVVVCSAGNSGRDSWKKISVPADAENVLTVGAVDRKGLLAPFSSIGNTADGRIKPDVMAVGLNASVIKADGNTSHADGTSFSSPIMCGMVACLWQACPKLTAKEVIELVRQCGDRADAPDNIYGYGIPDLWNAYKKVNP